jgi:hypothetical protein
MPGVKAASLFLIFLFPDPEIELTMTCGCALLSYGSYTRRATVGKSRRSGPG